MDSPPLVVDLDNTLIRSDLLHETFFDAVAHRPVTALRALLALRSGRSVLKARLADDTTVDIGHLPYNEAVLAHIEACRREGRRTALVSASDDRLVKAVADHLDCFDEAFGSDESRNLKGPAKAAFLVDRYGTGGFDYVGDSRADLTVWPRARRAIAVGVSGGLRRSVEALGPEVIHLPGRFPDGGALAAYGLALRPHQWLKNALVFLPAFAAHALTPVPWVAALLAFIAFSLTASSVYILNDLLDLSADRTHPRKRHRPFASGTVPIHHGVLMVPILLVAALVLAVVTLPVLFLGVLGLYYAATLAYSLVLKRLLVIDICTLAGLYTLRVIGGAAATGYLLSPWMVAFSTFLFFALAAMKRQTELVDGMRRGRSKTAGRAYETDDLPIVAMMAIASGYAAVLVLALYIDSQSVRALYASPAILWAACPVLLFWISRLVMIALRGDMHHDPVVFAVRDPVSLACGVALFIVALVASYA